jgi:P-type E1-E2 ATPase
LIEIDIPDFGRLELEHLVLDYNGTLAVDGVLLPGVAERLTELDARISIHVVTADTFGMVREAVAGLPVALRILPKEAQAEAKRDFVSTLGGERTAAIGNGRNDRLMLSAAALGIAVVQQEGAAASTLAAADVVTPTIADALELLSNPLRLVASLRS